MAVIAQFVYLLVTILTFAIFIRSILSWFPGGRDNALAGILAQITDPILEPLRRVIPPMGMIDITPLVAILLLLFIGRVILLAA